MKKMILSLLMLINISQYIHASESKTKVYPSKTIIKNIAKLPEDLLNKILQYIQPDEKQFINDLNHINNLLIHETPELYLNQMYNNLQNEFAYDLVKQFFYRINPKEVINDNKTEQEPLTLEGVQKKPLKLYEIENNQTTNTVLIEAIIRRNDDADYRFRICKDLANLALYAGANPNEISFVGEPPLISAVRRYNHGSCENLDQIKLLLECGANPNQQDDEEGKTSLHYAAQLKNPEIALLLLRYGADCSILNKKSKLPLDYARHPELRTRLQPNVENPELYATPQTNVENVELRTELRPRMHQSCCSIS